MKDVTDLVWFSNNDDELLPITQCVCGAKYVTWDFVISIYPEDAYECPACHRKLYFSLGITVYEVEED
jgi:hypothetical protein